MLLIKIKDQRSKADFTIKEQKFRMVILHPISRPRITLTMLNLLITYFLGNIEEETHHSLQDKMSYGTKTPTELLFQHNSRAIEQLL